MQTNLLPNVNTPYLMVVTVYPGASPERVENEVSDVMESALGKMCIRDSLICLCILRNLRIRCRERHCNCNSYFTTQKAYPYTFCIRCV